MVMFSPGNRRDRLRLIFPVSGWAIGAVVLFGVGCNERNRLTFPNLDGEGPQSTILDPSQDTTVTAGPFAQVFGRVTDLDGIDTVYFEVTGGGASFQPHIGNGDDTVTFSLPLATAGLGGTTMTVMVFGTDIGGVRGDTAVRQVTVQ
jgi:hypothetical protein